MHSTERKVFIMSKRQEALRKLALGLSQRDVCRSVKISSATIVQLKKFCRERNISFLEASKLSDEELMGKSNNANLKVTKNAEDKSTKNGE